MSGVHLRGYPRKRISSFFDFMRHNKAPKFCISTVEKKCQKSPLNIFTETKKMKPQHWKFFEGGGSNFFVWTEDFFLKNP